MFIIAEIGQAHDGSLGILHSYIDAAAETGVDAIKFQTHVAEAESSPLEPFRVNFSYVDPTRMDYWRRMGFTADQWAGIKTHCDRIGLEFMSSPFSLAAAELLERLDMARWKIGSGEVNNLLMLEKIARTGKPILLSSGMSSVEELRRSVEFLRPFGNPLSLMQCTTAYPSPPERWGLNVIGELRQAFGLPVGYSDHSGGTAACLAAAALGAELLEFHLVFDRRMFGPDATSSVTVDEARTLVAGARQIAVALANPVDKTTSAAYAELKGMFEKSLAINRAVPAGHAIAFEDLEAKKPAGQGIPAGAYRSVIGRRLNRPMEPWSFLNESDME